MVSIGQFLREVRVEMGKVAWPTKTQLIAYTFVVIGLTAIMAVYLGLLDLGFQKALTKFILK